MAMRARYFFRSFVYFVYFVLFWLAFSFVEKQRSSCSNKSHQVRINDAFDFMLDPSSSKRDNFGVLFERTLQKAGKVQGNFLEIGGGSGKFFDHNMKNFGNMIANYIIIEPYIHLSKEGKPLQEFMDRVDKWKLGDKNDSRYNKCNCDT